MELPFVTSVNEDEPKDLMKEKERSEKKGKDGIGKKTEEEKKEKQGKEGMGKKEKDAKEKEWKERE